MRIKLFGPALALAGIASVTIAATATTEAIANLKKRYSAITTLHLLATATISVRGEVSTVRYEYYGQGNAYRIRSRTKPPIAGIAKDVDVAYDGDQWQIFYPGDAMLQLSRSEPATVPAAHPNPLFLSLAFLSPPASVGQMNLNDLASPTTWARAERLGTQVQQQSYEVSFAEADGLLVPASVVRYAASGAKDLEIAAEEFVTQDSAVGPLPRRVRARGYASDGKPMMDANFLIDTLEVNRGLPPNVFTIDPKRALRVYDADTGVFLKTPEDRVRGRRIVPERHVQ